MGTVPPGEDDMSQFVHQLGVRPQKIEGLSREISWRDFAAIWKVFQHFRRFQPQIVHTHTAKAGTVGRIGAILYRFATLRILLGRPRPCWIVHTYHGHVFHSYFSAAKTRFFLLVERVLARFTDRIVVISDGQLAEESTDSFAWDVVPNLP